MITDKLYKQSQSFHKSDMGLGSSKKDKEVLYKFAILSDLMRIQQYFQRL